MTPDDIRDSIQHTGSVVLQKIVETRYPYVDRLKVTGHTHLNSLHTAFVPVEDQVEDDVADFLVTLKFPNRRTQALNHDLPTCAYGLDLEFPDQFPDDLDALLKAELQSNVDWTDEPFRAPSNMAANASVMGMGSKARTAISRLTQALSVLDAIIFGQLEDLDASSHSLFLAVSRQIQRALPEGVVRRITDFPVGEDRRDMPVFEEVYRLVEDATQRNT